MRTLTLDLLKTCYMLSLPAQKTMAVISSQHVQSNSIFYNSYLSEIFSHSSNTAIIQPIEYLAFYNKGTPIKLSLLWWNSSVLTPFSASTLKPETSEYLLTIRLVYKTSSYTVIC